MHHAGDAATARTDTTHPHGRRDAPGAGLAVARPEGAIVPADGRVELQLMPLLLQGRKEGGQRKEAQRPRSQPLALSVCRRWVFFLFCFFLRAMQMPEMRARDTLRGEKNSLSQTHEEP